MGAPFDFFYDLASPYSYLASTQLRGLEQRTGSRARLVPVTLGGMRKATGHVMPPPAQLRYMSEDTARWAQQYGVPMQIPKAFPVSTIKALRICIAAEDVGRAADAMHALFRTYWVDGADLSDPSVIENALLAADLDGKACSRERRIPRSRTDCGRTPTWRWRAASSASRPSSSASAASGGTTGSISSRRS